MGSLVPDLGLGLDDLEDEPLPPDPSPAAEAPAVKDGYSRYPELDLPLPTRFRTIDTASARFFGFAHKEELKAVIEDCKIGEAVQSFTEIRKEFDSRFKTEEGAKSRPTSESILERLRELRSTHDSKLDLSIANLREELPKDELDLYAIAYNIFHHRWFIQTSAPFKGLGLNTAMELDRVSGLVKVLDKNQKDGYSQINRNRDSKSTNTSLKHSKATVHQSLSGALRELLPTTQQSTATAVRTQTNTNDEVAMIQNPEEKPTLQNAGTAEDDPLNASDSTSTPSKPTKVKRDLQAMPSTQDEGINVRERSAGKQQMLWPKSEHTPDERNPKASWFKDGKVNGYSEQVIDEICNFIETKWDALDDELSDSELAPDMHTNTSKEDTESSQPALGSQEQDKELQRLAADTSDLAIREKAKNQNAESMARQKRLERVYKVTRFTEQDLAECQHTDDEPDFTTKVLSCSKYNGLADTELSTRVDGELQFADANDEQLRAQVDDVSKLMDNKAFQPSNYRQALNTARVASYRNPRLPGQSGNMKKMMFWQILGAAHMYKKRFQANKKRLEQLAQLIAANHPFANEASRDDVDHGIILADEVGIGKTNTAAAYRLICLNERKADLQRFRDNEDWESLKNYPPPRPLLALTPSHLVTQFAASFAAYSENFSVYVYGSVIKALPPGVRRIDQPLKRSHPVFDHSNELNCQVVIVSSYQTMAIRHGPHRRKVHLAKHPDKFSKEEVEHMKVLDIRDRKNPLWRATYDLDGLFDEAMLDEGQNTKGVASYSSNVIRSLGLDWTTIITATPIPYKHNDFAGLLSFVQSPHTNAVARARIHGHQYQAQKWPAMGDPYGVTDHESKSSVPSLPFDPENQKYMYTAAAFQHFVCGPNVSVAEAGARLACIWARFMIRRDFTSSCVVDPKGTRVQIGQCMPKSHRFTVQLKNPDEMQNLHDLLVQDHISKTVMRDPNHQGEMILNGRSARLLGLAAISPPLLLAKDIHRARVRVKSGALDGKELEDDGDEEWDEDDYEVDGEDIPRDKNKMVKTKENPHLKEYREFFLTSQNKEFLYKLSEDIYRNAAELEHPQHTALFPEPELKTCPSVRLAAYLIRHSVRLCALIQAVCDQVDKRNEKALIFANNPWEAMFYTVLFRVFSYKAEAVLAHMKAGEKEDIVHRFQSRLSRWSAPGALLTQEGDVEILVLSYYMNSGLNLHQNCHNLHAPSPPPALAVWAQSCGRLIRFGQPFEVLILRYHVANTYNATQASQLAKNALVTIAAFTYHDNEQGETFTGVKATREDLDHLHGFNNGLIDDRHPDYESLCEKGLVQPLKQDDKFLRILNILLGLNIKLDVTTGAVEAASDIFVSANGVTLHSTPKSKSEDHNKRSAIYPGRARQPSPLDDKSARAAGANQDEDLLDSLLIPKPSTTKDHVKKAAEKKFPKEVQEGDEEKQDTGAESEAVDRAARGVKRRGNPASTASGGDSRDEPGPPKKKAKAPAPKGKRKNTRQKGKKSEAFVASGDDEA